MTHNHFNSRNLSLALLLAPAAILAPAPALHAEAPDDENYLGESPERYAQVKIVEGEVTIRKGDGDEPLTRGIPVAEGDVVESSGRGVLQLGDGTRVAFGKGTRFQVAALFTDKKGERQVLLRLDHGRLRLALGSQSEARIRVDTPAGVATLADRGGATCEVERDRTVRLRVHSGRISFANDADRNTVAAGERLTVYGNQDRLDRVRSFNTYDADAFDEWCEDHLTPRRRAHSDKVPREIRYFADDLDDHGDWIYVDETSSWCWRPRGVSVEWRPYWRGRWGAYSGGMTWVSDEPWGYVTYHHGRWGWGASLGWYWIPGVYYSPAWVAWNTHDSYFGWAPLGYWNYPCTWGYGAWGGGHCWNVVNVHHIGHHGIHTRTHTDVHVIHTFDRGTGASTWTSTGRGGRSLTPPWQRSPLVVTRTEFSNANQFQRVAGQRPLHRERLEAYDRQAQSTTGRSVLRRDTVQSGSVPHGTAATPAGPGRDGAGASSGFRSSEERRPGNTRPLLRENARPIENAAPRGTVREPADRGRAVEERQAPRERREERVAPRENPREERRPAPREERTAPREERPAPREERTAPREEQPAPRERPRESYREERAPARETPRSEPYRESRPSSPPASSPSPAPSHSPGRPVRR
jgi:hypothetical protein